MRVFITVVPLTGSFHPLDCDSFHSCAGVMAADKNTVACFKRRIGPRRKGAPLIHEDLKR